jgi:hypothetical protein
MSTPAVVAVPYGDGWRGRAVNGDGYPTWTGAKLLELVERDGPDKVIDTVVNSDIYGWSYLDPNMDETQDHLLGKRARPVPGYGLAYTTVQDQTDPEDWGTPENVASYEWVYLLGKTGLRIGRGKHFMLYLTYSRVNDPNLPKVLEEIENGE